MWVFENVNHGESEGFVNERYFLPKGCILEAMCAQEDLFFGYLTCGF